MTLTAPVKRCVKRSCAALLGRLPGLRWEKIKSRIDPIEGFLVPGQDRWLFEAARSLADGTVMLEIGAFKGRSTCCLAYGCLGTRKHVWSIDTFCGNDTDFVKRGSTGQVMATGFFHEWFAHVRSCGLQQYVTALKGLSRDFYATWSRPIGFLFIDGSHEYQDVLADFESFYPHVAQGGIVALHDVTRDTPGPYRVWHEHARHKLRDTGVCSTIAYGCKP